MDGDLALPGHGKFACYLIGLVRVFSVAGHTARGTHPASSADPPYVEFFSLTDPCPLPPTYLRPRMRRSRGFRMDRLRARAAQVLDFMLFRKT